MTGGQLEVPPAQPLDGGIWTARRNQLHAALKLRGDETVADLYRRAVDALGEDPLSTGALVVGSHCIREFVNRLPRVLGELQVESSRSDGGAQELLARALADYDADPTSDATAHVVDAARGLIDTRREASERAAQMRAALVLGPTEAGGGRPTLTAVKRAVDWFEKYRHPQNKDLSRWPTSSMDSVIQHLEVIEQALYGRLGRFFDVYAELRDLLEAANAKVGSEWVTPTPQTVRGAIPRLADPQHRRVFYLGLDNPRWIAELDAQHAFSDPPKHSNDHGGSTPYQAWPQGDYLRKMAAAAPLEVAQILAKAFNDDVAWSVRELIVATASEVPRDAAAILATPVVRCISSGFASRFIGVDAVAVVETLASGTRAQRRKARTIANALLEPFRDPDGPERPLLGRFTVISNVDHYDYEDAVRRVVEAFASDLGILEDLARWLASEQVLSGTFDPNGYDTSHIRRPSITNRRLHASLDTLADVLIDGVRDCAADLIPSAGLARVLQTLRRYPAPIFLRIELYCLTHEIQRAREQNQWPTEDVLIESVHRLADPDLADDRNCHRELDLLATAALPLFEEADYLRWERAVLKEPAFDEATRERIASFSPSNLTTDEAVADFIDRRRLHRLSAVEPQALRGRARAMYDELTATYGPVPDQVESEEWREAPDAALGFEDMTPNQVLLHTARQSAAQGATHGSGDTLRHVDRLGRAFAQAVRLAPREFSGLAQRVLTLEPIIVGYFLSGLTDALRPVGSNGPGDDDRRALDRPASEAQSILDWDSLLDALADSALRHDASPSPLDLQQWRSVRKHLCRLLEEGARSDMPTALLGRAIAVAATMCADTDPTAERDQEVHEHAVRDPLSYSADTVRSCALHTLIVLVAAHIRRVHKSTLAVTEDTLTADPVVQDAVATLERPLAPQRDPSIAVAAVFGEHAVWLHDYLPGWFRRHSARLGTPDAIGEAYIRTALTTHQAHLGLLEAVQPGLTALLRLHGHLESSESDPRRDTLPQLFGDRVLKLYLFGVIELDHALVREYHVIVPLADRAAVITELGWQMARADAVEPAVAERAMVLWDSRRRAAEDADGGDLAELAGFESWVRCGCIPAGWWLPRLVDLARDVEIEALAFVGDQLADAASDNLPATLVALDLLVRQAYGRTRAIPYQLRRAAHRILPEALQASDGAVAHRADELLNFIGRNSGMFIDPELTALAERGATDAHA